MGAVRDEIMREKKLDIECREKALLRVKDSYAKLELLIDELEKLELPIPRYVGADGLRFRCKTEEEASELVRKLVIQFPAEKVGRFEKQFDSGDGTWYWEAVLCESMKISVIPAPVSEDCIPVKEERTHSSWICKAKSEERR